MAEEKLKLSVDTGSVLVDVEDNGGAVIGQFRFNPGDFDIVKRYDTFVEYLNSITLGDNPTADEVLAVSDKIKEYFDFLLGYPVAEGIFAKCNPFSPTTNGDLYFENVLAGIENLIETTMNRRIAKKRRKIRAATAKYHK